MPHKTRCKSGGAGVRRQRRDTESSKHVSEENGTSRQWKKTVRWQKYLLSSSCSKSLFFLAQQLLCLFLILLIIQPLININRFLLQALPQCQMKAYSPFRAYWDCQFFFRKTISPDPRRIKNHSHRLCCDHPCTNALSSIMPKAICWCKAFICISFFRHNIFVFSLSIFR